MNRLSQKMHFCSPSEYKQTPNVTGDYDMDESIHRCTNTDLPNKIKLYTLTDETGYGPRTGYQGYSGYSGDD